MATSRVALASWLALGAAVGTAIPAHAENDLHIVVYRVWSDTAMQADIYFRETDPPNWADYSHNPYQFSPRAQAEVGPDQPWVREVTLRDPGRWATVTATGGQSTSPNLHCTLEVDGQQVTAASGPKGALCSIRHW